MDEWLKNAEDFLVDTWGLKRSFAVSVALFIAYLYQYRLTPVITSGFRSKAKQKLLRQQWNAGTGSAVYPPSDNSLHSKTNFLMPAAEAVDIKTTDPSYAAKIASALGIKAGYYFSRPDPVHFYQ